MPPCSCLYLHCFDFPLRLIDNHSGMLFSFQLLSNIVYALQVMEQANRVAPEHNIQTDAKGILSGWERCELGGQRSEGQSL